MAKAEYAILAFVAAGLYIPFAPLRGNPKEVYAIHDDPALQIGGGVEEVQEKEAQFAAAGFAVEHRGESTIWIYKKARLMLWTSDPILMLNIKNGKIIGKGFRIMEGNYALCDAPADAGEVVPTVPLPDGRSCTKA